MDINAHRQPFAIDQDEQLTPFAAFGWPHAFAPFFAGTKVASAIATFQSMRPFRSSLCSTRRHASSKTPLFIHSLNRRQQVVSEGNSKTTGWKPVGSGEIVNSGLKSFAHDGVTCNSSPPSWGSVPLACSPKSAPCVMRVSEPFEGEERLHVEAAEAA
jgi:hypothetical protein